MSLPSPLRVLGLAGSLRERSYNRMVLAAARALAPEGMIVEPWEGLRDVPLYNDDLRLHGYPLVVADLRQRIAAADALLIVTPEYNHGIPGVLKNAIDWASRPPEQPFADKPIALMGAATGMLGTVRAQAQLRQCFVYLDGRLLSRPEVLIGGAAQKFSGGGLSDEPTAAIIKDQLLALQAWTRRLQAGA